MIVPLIINLVSNQRFVHGLPLRFAVSYSPFLAIRKKGAIVTTRGHIDQVTQDDRFRAIDMIYLANFRIIHCNFACVQFSLPVRGNARASGRKKSILVVIPEALLGGIGL